MQILTVSSHFGQFIVGARL